MVLTFRRTDILFTLQQGGHPLFYRDEMIRIQSSLVLRGFPLKSNQDSHHFGELQLSITIREAFSNLMRVCDLFNQHIDKKPLDLVEFQEILVSVCYRLLSFRTLNESRLSKDIDSAYSIGLLIFIMSIFWNNHQSRLAKPGLIAACVKKALEVGDELEEEFVFWLLVLGGISVSGVDDREWMLVRLRRRAREASVITWDDARSCLLKFPWISVVHDASGQGLWNKVQSMEVELKDGVMMDL